MNKGRLVAKLVFIIIFFTLAWFGYQIYQATMRPMVAPSSPPVIIQLDKNSTALSFAQNLESKHLIPARLLLMLIRLQDLSADLKAGIYRIKPGESAQHFLKRVVAGDVLVESFKIIEGTTLSQVKANLEQARYLHYDPNDWLSLDAAYPSQEGLLLADTYQYRAGSDAKKLLQLAQHNLWSYLNQAWQNRSPNLPYKSPYQLLIAASILEKETSLPKERKIIAGIIGNRLKKIMPLQMDPTIIYAMGTNFHGNLSHRDLDIDSPYNTYRYRGLPPTPIAMVGKEAIDAAAHPDVTDYLYFVAKGDGSHHFSSTYEEQKKAIDQYQSGTRHLETKQ